MIAPATDGYKIGPVPLRDLHGLDGDGASAAALFLRSLPN